MFQERDPVAVDLVHPDGVLRVAAHHQVSIAQGSRVISLAGQVGWDGGGDLVGGGDLAAQAAQCYRNIAAALVSVGSSIMDVTRFTLFIVGLDPEKGEQVMVGRDRAAAELRVTLQQPGTYIGVTSLFSPDFLIEIEATAVSD